MARKSSLFVSGVVKSVVEFVKLLCSEGRKMWRKEERRVARPPKRLSEGGR